MDFIRVRRCCITLRCARRASSFARQWWDRRVVWFTRPESSLGYLRFVGWWLAAFVVFFAWWPRLAAEVRTLFEADSVETQRVIYDQRIEPQMWAR
ncbi:MAG: DUF3419 family protein [Gammaproteobacteria bacterium]